jgi:DNA-binding MarR family transcriptional regulator
MADKLTPFQYRVLEALNTMPGHRFAASWIASRVWGSPGLKHNAQRNQSMGAKLFRMTATGFIFRTMTDDCQNLWSITERGRKALAAAPHKPDCDTQDRTPGAPTGKPCNCRR